MQRLLSAAAAVALVAGLTSTAHAEPRASNQTITVTYTKADLRDPAAFQALQQRIADKVDGFCRANPIAGTVSECRRILSQPLRMQADTRRQAALEARTNEAYAAR